MVRNIKRISLAVRLLSCIARGTVSGPRATTVNKTYKSIFQLYYTLNYFHKRAAR